MEDYSALKKEGKTATCNNVCLVLIKTSSLLKVLFPDLRCPACRLLYSLFTEPFIKRKSTA